MKYQQKIQIISENNELQWLHNMLQNLWYKEIHIVKYNEKESWIKTEPWIFTIYSDSLINHDSIKKLIEFSFDHHATTPPPMNESAFICELKKYLKPIYEPNNSSENNFPIALSIKIEPTHTIYTISNNYKTIIHRICNRIFSRKWEWIEDIINTYWLIVRYNNI